MQEESLEKLSQGARLKNLHVKRQCNWSVIAEDIKLSEGMIFAVISGKKFLSDKALYRLAELERAAGIEPPKVSYGEIKPQHVALADAPKQNLLDVVKTLNQELKDAKAELANLKSILRELTK